MDSTRYQDFIKCQGTKVLSSLPAGVRNSLRHLEVAAILQPFQPRPPLQGAQLSKSFVYAVVTDWSLLLLALSTSNTHAREVMELPLLYIQDVEVDALDVHDFANDTRGDVRSSRVTIYPQQTHHLSHQRTQQQQQQNPDAQAQQHPVAAQQQEFKQTSNDSLQAKATATAALAPEPSTVKQLQQQFQLQLHAKHVVTPEQQKQRQQQQLTQQIIARLHAAVQQQGLAMQWPSQQLPQHRQQQQQQQQHQQQHQQPHQQPHQQEQLQQQLPRSNRIAGPITEAAGNANSNALVHNNVSVLDRQQLAAGTADITTNQLAEQAANHQLHTELTAAGSGDSSAGVGLSKRRQLKAGLTVTVAAPRIMHGTQPPDIQQALPIQIAAQQSQAHTLAEQQQQPPGRHLVEHQATDEQHQQLQVLQQQQQTERPVTPTQLWSQQQAAQPLQQLANSRSVIDAEYCLCLITVERCSCLALHIHQAWVGAHMRAALAAAAVPGHPAWLAPPANHRPADSSQDVQQNLQANSPSKGQPPRPGSPLLAVKAWFAGFGSTSAAGPSQTSPNSGLSPGGWGLVSHADASSWTASALSPASFSELPADAQAALHADMIVFFGLTRDSSGARKAVSPFPGDDAFWHFHHQQQKQQLLQARKSTSQVLTDLPNQWHAAAHWRHSSSMTGAMSDNNSVGAAKAGRNQQVARGSTNSSLWENDSLLEERMRLVQVASQHRQPLGVDGSGTLRSSTILPVSPSLLATSATSPTLPAEYSKLLARRSTATRYSTRPASANGAASAASPLEQQQQQQQKQHVGFQLPHQQHGLGWLQTGDSVHSSSKRHMLRSYMQVGASMYAQHSACAARKLFWDLAEQLTAKPCSLFDGHDTDQIKQLALELAFCDREQVSALQQAFFESPSVLSFILARATSWGAIMSLFPEGLPPIQNPAQPGALDAWQGKLVVWAPSLLHPGRPSQLLGRLELLNYKQLCFRSVLAAAHALVKQQQQAAKTAKDSDTTPSSAVRQQPMVQAYYADPLNLSPLNKTPYLFVSAARMMETGASSSSADRLHLSESSEQQGPHAATKCSSSYRNGSSAGGHCNSSDDLSCSSTLAEATSILRWERLVGRLTAELAGSKMQLLLYWLQMQLAFSEGCSARRAWLSDKMLDPGACVPGQPVPAPWSFRDATQQLLATLLTLQLPGSGVSPASKQFIPGGVDDLLWWAQSGASSWVLDYVVGVVFELMGICQQEALKTCMPAGADIIKGVILQVPAARLQPLVCQLFLRFICIMGGSASSREWRSLPPALVGVLGYKYGSVLCEVLDGVAGAADRLHDAFCVEVQHLLQTPQVHAQVMVALGASGGANMHGCVLGQQSLALLREVLLSVEAAVPWARQPAAASLTVAGLGHMERQC